MIGKINSHSLASIILEDMQCTKEKFTALHNKLIDNLLIEHLRKVIVDNDAKSQVAIDILIRNLFERTADVGFLATDDDIRLFLSQNDSDSQEHTRSLIESRLGEYVKKYSVYDEIIILDPDGNVCAHLDQTNKISKSNDPLIKETLKTSEEYAETFRYSDLQAQKQQSLIYSCKITANNAPDSEILGVLCLCFRFDDEVTGIFNKLLIDSDSTLLLISKRGDVVASSNPSCVPLESHFKYNEAPHLLTYQGNEYLINSTQTNGYQGFYGLGWWAMVMTPVKSAFKQVEETQKLSTAADELHSSQLFSEALKEIHHASTIVNDDLSLVVLNGQVTALRQKAAEFMPVLEAIKEIGQNTARIFSDSIRELQTTVVSSHLSDAAFMAALAVDIMDRNFYERANDCRWWALTSTFRESLDKPQISREETQLLSEILAYINNLYTVYTNLYLFDKTQRIVAVSNSEQSSLIGQHINEQSGANSTLSLTDSQQYAVSPFIITPLYENRHTYIYNAAVTSAKTEQVIGGIGIVFDSEPQFAAMLADTLPHDENGNIAAGCFAVFTEPTGKIIAATEEAPCSVGEKLEVDEQLLNLGKGQSHAEIYSFQGTRYILGVATSSGYREYKTTGDYDNDVVAFIFIPI